MTFWMLEFGINDLATDGLFKRERSLKLRKTFFFVEAFSTVIGNTVILDFNLIQLWMY